MKIYTDNIYIYLYLCVCVCVCVCVMSDVTFQLKLHTYIFNCNINVAGTFQSHVSTFEASTSIRVKSLIMA